MDSSTLALWTGPFKIEGVSFYYYYVFIQMPVYKANSVDTDQTPRSAASDRDLHCLLMSLLLDARHKRVHILAHPKVGSPFHYRLMYLEKARWQTV